MKKLSEIIIPGKETLSESFGISENWVDQLVDICEEWVNEVGACKKGYRNTDLILLIEEKGFVAQNEG